ncbi:MAG TPA: hypothetical protein VF458_05040 [Ktedonobacteraceae bacterium]
MKHTHNVFRHAKKWFLLAGVTLLLGLLLSLGMLARAASAFPLPTHPAGTEKQVARSANPPELQGSGPQDPGRQDSRSSQTQRDWGGSAAYVFNTKAQIVAVNRPVLFDTFPPAGGARRGFIYNPATGELIPRQAAAYRVTFSVTNNASNVFVLAINGIPVPGTAYLSNSTLANNGNQNNGQAIIFLNPWDRLTLQNRSGGPVNLVPLFTNGAPGTPATVNASLLAEQIGL